MMGPSERLSRKEEYKLNDKLKGDMSDEQHVSVHHKTPIGSAKDIITNLFGKLPIVKLKQKAKELVNVFGNLELVIGREKHQSLEPRKVLQIKEKPNNAIMEARLNPAYMARICQDRNLPANLRQELEKYKNQTDIFETMNYSHSSLIEEIRPKTKTSKIRGVFEAIKQYMP